MSAILGIDAAWTTSQPSGVALIRAADSKWQCIAVAPSYHSFIGLATGLAVDWSQASFPGAAPNVQQLLLAARSLAHSNIDVVAIDMPMSTVPILSRRAADDAISKEFGARLCSAHTPSTNRPGDLGARLSAAFIDAGFPLATAGVSEPFTPCLLEVYPHPALLSLLRRSQRVPYKISKVRSYWPQLTAAQRTQKLLEELGNIHEGLTKAFGPLNLSIPAAAGVPRFSTLKRYEDALDSLVCAWVGAQYLEGKAIGLGDRDAAIWCPKDVLRHSQAG